MRKCELKPKQLRNAQNPNSFKFKTTDELPEFNGVIGQERALNALNMGTNIEVKGYNMFLTGISGIGKTAYAQEAVNKAAKKRKVPSDWCYVYNFSNPNEPLAIDLPAGMGNTFKTDMDKFISNILVEIPRSFNNDNYRKEKAAIVKTYEDKKNALLNLLNETAEKQGFKIYNTDGNIYFMPILEGKAIEEKEYSSLDEKIKKEIEVKSTVVQTETVEVMKRIKSVDADSQFRISEWENNIVMFAVGFQINDLKSKYKKYKKVICFLESVQYNILKNISAFCQNTATPEQKNTYKPWLDYRVNVFVDNSCLSSAPVITDLNPTYNGLFGKLEYENSMGGLKTDHTMIVNGLIHRANGGFLILQAKDLMTNPALWESFKRTIRNRSLQIDTSKDTMQNVSITSLRPEQIPLDIKVILIGTEVLYNNLLVSDPDFKKLFKIKADFDTHFVRDEKNVQKLAQFISGFCKHEELLPFTPDGVAKMIEYSSRLAGDQNKLSSQFSSFGETISEAATVAAMYKQDCVTAENVDEALKNKKYRNGKMDDDFISIINDGTMMISTSGHTVGQINGLTIINTMDMVFGKPVRITANTFIGKSGVINIEREVALSGSSHSKGILILSSYIGERFAQDMPLSLTASICFEQLYSGIDGDSASSTELYAVLSSLADLPINQSIAVTGSVNQKGEIQPVGGVTEKIEGFFKICKLNGLTSNNAIMMPYQNISNLNLSDEVVQAVENNEFHIYAIQTIDEGLEILTGVPAGKMDKNNKYPAGTVNYMVYEKLKKYSNNSKI